MPNQESLDCEGKHDSERKIEHDDAPAGTSNLQSSGQQDNFIASMTFANPEELHRRGNGGYCDCDECFAVGATKNGNKRSFVPNAIQQALDEYRRKRPLQRTVERKLLETVYLKDNQEEPESNTTMITLWLWTLPVGSSPLLEFGDSHRFVWVKRFNNKTSKLQETGTGVIGSQLEQQGRIDLPWQQDRLYFVPSRKGKAIGWVHSEGPNDDHESHSGTGLRTNSGPVVFLVVKIPSKSSLLSETRDVEDEKCESLLWAKEAVQLARNLMGNISCCTDGEQNEQPPRHVAVSPENARHLLELLREKTKVET